MVYEVFGHPAQTRAELNVPIPGHELVGERLAAEDVYCPLVVVGHEAAPAVALLLAVVVPQAPPGRRPRGALMGRGGGGVLSLRPQRLQR